MRSSRLPYVRTLTDFDFAFQPSIKREQIDALHELGFLERKENVVFLGPPGFAMAISLGLTSREPKIYKTTDREDSGGARQGRYAPQLDRRQHELSPGPALLIVDEIGYLPVTRAAARSSSSTVNRRYGRASTVLTSNKGFEEWGRILGDEVMAARCGQGCTAATSSTSGATATGCAPRRAVEGDPSELR